jgi:hypothetical protein
MKSEEGPEKWLLQLTIHRVCGILFYDRYSRDDLAILSVSGPHYSENKRSNEKWEEKGNRSMGKRLIILVCSMLIVLSGHSAVRGQQNAYIVVHAINPEGIEISSIEGMNKYSISVYDGNSLIGFSGYNSKTTNRPIGISPGTHSITAIFNGITGRETITIEPNEIKIITFLFDRTEFDLAGYLDNFQGSSEEMSRAESWDAPGSEFASEVSPDPFNPCVDLSVGADKIDPNLPMWFSWEANGGASVLLNSTQFRLNAKATSERGIVKCCG